MIKLRPIKRVVIFWHAWLDEIIKADDGKENFVACGGIYNSYDSVSCMECRVWRLCG